MMQNRILAGNLYSNDFDSREVLSPTGYGIKQLEYTIHDILSWIFQLLAVSDGTASSAVGDKK
ncbi:hypothetical protein AGMMS50229_21320 [Campylobacterota bacterium]|nr:hypothetical protein AGMMS50229_21320 [Campylobacterota bacterium]